MCEKHRITDLQVQRGERDASIVACQHAHVFGESLLSDLVLAGAIVARSVWHTDRVVCATRMATEARGVVIQHLAHERIPRAMKCVRSPHGLFAFACSEFVHARARVPLVSVLLSLAVVCTTRSVYDHAAILHDRIPLTRGFCASMRAA